MADQEEDQGITAYHASPVQISAFKPSQFRGATYFAPTPKSALSGASAGMNEMVMETATEPYSGAMHVHEVSIDPEQIKGLHYTPKEKEWFKSLPNKVVGDDALEQIFKSSPNSDIQWDDLYDHHKIGDRLYEYTKRKSTPSITYEQAQKTGRDVYGKRHSHYGHGADEKRAAKNALENGMKGYLMHDEGGLSIAMADPSLAKIKDIKKFADGGSVNDGITAYHGSPHEFEKFDIEKIGTGEGAQAFGHGLYFAEHEPIAQSYREKLSSNPAYLKYDGQSASSLHSSADVDNNLKAKVAFEFHNEGDIQKAIDNVERKLKGQLTSKMLLPEDKPVLEHHLNLLNEMRQNPPTVEKHKGHMYEVKINSHPDNFLDWDKPLIEQPEHIRRLAGLTPEYESAYLAARKSDTDSLFSALDQNTEYKRTPMPRRPEGALPPTMTGADFYEHLKNQMGAIDWPPDADYLTREHHRKVAGENVGYFLSKRGVHGIKYLDRGSRKVGEGTRNYVVFDDKLVNLKRRYARGGAVPHNELDPAKEYKKETGRVHPELKIQVPIEGTKERMSNMRADVPVRWASSPDHPSAHLAYITDEEAELLKRADLHNSNIANEHHVGPGGIPSYQGGGIGSGGSSYSGNGGMDSPSESGPGPGMGGGSSTGGGGGGGGGSSIGIGGGGGGGGGSSIGGGGGGGGMPGIGLGSVDAFGAPGSMKTFGSSDPGQEADKSMVDALSAGMKPGGNIGSSFVKEAISPDLSGGNSPLASGISQYDRSALDARMDRMRAAQQAERDQSYERSVIGPTTPQINVPNAGDLYGATNAPLAIQPPSGMFGQPTMGTTQFGTGIRQAGLPSQQTGPMDPSQIGYAEQMAKSAREAWLAANTEPESPRLGDLATPTPNRPFAQLNRSGSVGSMPIGTTPHMADLTPLSSQPARPITPTPFSTFPQDVQRQMIPNRSDSDYGQTLIDPTGKYTKQALEKMKLAEDAVTMLNSPTLAGSLFRTFTPTPTPATPKQQAAIERMYKGAYGGQDAPAPSSTRSSFNQAFADARAAGQDTFSWTNPVTGKTGLYTTQLARKEGGRVPSLANPDDWVAKVNKPNEVRKVSKARKYKPQKALQTSIVQRAIMLSSRKS